MNFLLQVVKIPGLKQKLKQKCWMAMSPVAAVGWLLLYKMNAIKVQYNQKTFESTDRQK